MVRVAGFEPATYRFQTGNADQTALHSDKTGTGARSRTWAYGFGDRRATVTLHRYWMRTHESNMALLLMRQEWSPDHLTAKLVLIDGIKPSLNAL